MKILFLGLAIFCVALGLHLIIWKIRIPRGQTKAILIIFLATFIFSLLILGGIIQLSIKEQLHIALFYTSLALAYITTYSAVEADSPSLIMVMNIAKAGNEGIDKNKLGQIITDDMLIKPRIKDLVEDRMVYLVVDKYKLTPRGRLLSRIFIFYRKLLNAGKGG